MTKIDQVTKLVAEVVVTIRHKPGFRVTKKALKTRIETQLEYLEMQPDDFQFVKARVRSVDFD